MTIAQQLIYFRLSGVTYVGTPQELNYTSGVSTGSAAPSKALVLNEQNSVTGVNQLAVTSLVADTLTGTITTASQPNITSLGALSGLNVNGVLNVVEHNGVDKGLRLAGGLVQTTASEINYLKVTPGSVSTNKALVLDGTKSISGISNLQSDIVRCNQIMINGTYFSSTGEKLNVVDIGSAGSAEAGKALVLDQFSGISGIKSITSDVCTIGSNANNCLTVQNTASTGSANVLYKSNMVQWEVGVKGSDNGALSNAYYVATNGANRLVVKQDGKLGVGTATPAYTVDVNGDVSYSGSLRSGATLVMDNTGVVQNANQSTITSLGVLTQLALSGPTVTTIQNDTSIVRNFTRWVNAGVSNVVCQVEMTNALARIGTSTAHPLRFVTNNANAISIEPNGNVNIGTLTNTVHKLNVNGSINVSSIYVNGIPLSISGSDPSTIAGIETILGITHGEASADKALVLSSTSTISGIDSLSSRLLYGEVSTPAQPSITSLGTLTSLSTSGLLSVTRPNNTATPINFSKWTNVATANVVVDMDVSNAVARVGTSSAHPFRIMSNQQESISIETDGSVNIGSTTPSAYKLNVNGSLNASSLYINGVAVGTGGPLDDVDAVVNDGELTLNKGLIVGNANTSVDNRCLCHKSINATELPSTSLASAYNICIQNNSATAGETSGIAFVNDTSDYRTITPTSCIRSLRSGTNGAGGIAFATREATTTTGGCLTRMLISATGNVGIGKTDPLYKLDLSGTARATKLCIGDSTEDATASRLITARTVAIPGSELTMCLGSADSAYNQSEISFRLVSNGDSFNNCLRLGLTGSTRRVQVYGTGHVRMGSPVIDATPPTAVLTIDQNSDVSAGLRLEYDTVDTPGTSVNVCSTSDGKLYVSNGMCVGSTASTGYGYVYIAGEESVGITDFAYHTSDNVVGYSATGTSSCSLRTSGRIVAGSEIDIVSDRRIKENIADITEEYCTEFLSKVSPKTFNYKKNPSKVNHGFIAQELHKAGYADLVNISYQPGVDREVDDDGFVSPQDHIFTVSMEEVIPILTKSVQLLTRENAELKTRLKALEDFVQSKFE